MNERDDWEFREELDRLGFTQDSTNDNLYFVFCLDFIFYARIKDDHVSLTMTNMKPLAWFKLTNAKQLDSAIKSLMTQIMLMI